MLRLGRRVRPVATWGAAGAVYEGFGMVGCLGVPWDSVVCATVPRRGFSGGGLVGGVGRRGHPAPARVGGGRGLARGAVVPVRGEVSMPVTTTPVLVRQDASRNLSGVAAVAEAEAEEPRPVLTDKHGRHHTYLRISLTERCNLRCTYCMPEEGIDLTSQDELLTTDEIVRLATMFVGSGIDKIRLTGGEPLIRPDCVELCTRLKAIPGLKQLGITTNAITLGRKLPALREAGVTHLNISLDTLCPHKYQIITRRNGLKRVLSAIDEALEQNFHPLKINAVVKRGMNSDELTDFVEWVADKNVEVRFIEYMPFDGNQWNKEKFVSYIEMLDTIKQKYPTFTRLYNDKHDTAKTWHVPGHKGRVAFITSMSNHFCGGCNRVRMTADGNLKVCLFGPTEVSLRDAMRSGQSEDSLLQLVGQAVGKKEKQHAGMFNIANTKNRPMTTIGG